MKQKMIKLAAFALLLAGTMLACGEKENADTYEKTGIIPASIEQIVDVFELKYGEKKECVYEGRSFKFSIADIDDQMLPCALIDFSGEPEAYDKVRIYVSLNMETNGSVTELKISSAPCMGYYYKNDGTDIQDIWNLFESWQSSLAQQEGHPYFTQEFANFGNGALLKNTSFSIHLGKWSPRVPEYKVDKSLYKFIFIISKNNK